MAIANQIRFFRTAQRLSQEEFGEKVGLTKFQVSRLENGETNLSVETGMRIAEVLGVTLEELVGLPRDTGFAEDLQSYEAPAGDKLAAALTGEHVYLFTVATDAIDLAGYPRGMIVQVNDSREAVQAVKPLQAVRVLYHPPGEFEKAISLLRLFVPPRLLITNSSVKNLPSLDADADDAHIIGVVEGGYRKFA